MFIFVKNRAKVMYFILLNIKKANYLYKFMNIYDLLRETGGLFGRIVGAGRFVGALRAPPLRATCKLTPHPDTHFY
ncbi:MAG: hypothetical protein LBN95_01265 [Prevotellaceae bacterium]|jgi:hypothetical protein|nr:hypothetical protein [Prevotellaceae bacterium]